MPNKMLIDASQPEETRVVVLRGNKVEEFDFESASRKQLRGNIYLAKVTRVEPSLQAAFVEYGGNRHGFLAFAEIHPDYYQIPVADRQALMEEEARAQAADEEDEQRQQRHSRRNKRTDHTEPKRQSSDGDSVSEPGPVSDQDAEGRSNNQDHDQEHDRDLGRDLGRDGDEVRANDAQPDAQSEFTEDADPHVIAGDSNDALGEGINANHAPATEDTLDAASPQNHPGPNGHEGDRGARRGNRRRGRFNRGSRDGNEQRASGPRSDGIRASEGIRPAADEPSDDGENDQVDQLGGDAMEEMPHRAPRLRRQYKIQEVIKRRQVLLIQVVKEERGNKGAALTTYLSLAGRYSVLMPNTARGGGISRKITDSGDRSRLKSIAQELEVPDGMGVILRTAGASRTKAEVKRDFEYLMRMWETVRELTLRSSAPMLVYEEGSLIKRAIRDLYNKDIDEVAVAGDDGYREARDFMRLLMPSHAKNVKLYRDPQPIFAKLGVEAQLDAMFSNQVTLKSGGYIVINQTEALVAIDVNSGRSTREHNIEDTAVRTNLEAADEVARQLRLRDLAGLIVVDFIDMDENRNNRSVERRMKDALANDRARIQVGRISHFGLLEMSRQRIRTGVLEGSTVQCAHCAGAGMVRSTASIALHVLRLLEDALLKSATHHVIARTRTEVALYILNQKREILRELESRFGVSLTIAADDMLTGANYHAFERGEVVVRALGETIPVMMRVETVHPSDMADEDIMDEQEEADADVVARADGTADAAPPHAQPAHRAAQKGNRERGGHERRPVDGAEPRAEIAGEDGEVARRRRRRRRRRGGADRDNGQKIAAGANQPSDDGMALLAETGGDLPSHAYVAAVPAQHEPGNGFMAHIEATADQPESALLTEDADLAESARAAIDSANKAAPRKSRSRAKKAPETEAGVGVPSTPAKRSRRPVRGKPSQEDAADTVQVAVAPHAPISEAPAVAFVAAPEPEAPAPAKPEPLPEAEVGPKRSGWWQRAKATLAGK